MKYNLYRTDLEYDFDHGSLAVPRLLSVYHGSRSKCMANINSEYDDLFSSELNKIKIYNMRQVGDFNECYK